MKRSLIFAGFVIILVVFLSTACKASLADYGIDVFDISTGARPSGMGGAFTAIGDDSSAIFYNPASQIGVGGIALSFRDTKNISIAQVYPMDTGTIGLGLISRSIKDLPTASGLLSNSGSFGIVSYAFKLGGCSLGANLKLLLNEELQVGSSDQNGSGWDVDLGILTTPKSWLRLGAMLQNILPYQTLGGASILWSGGTFENMPLLLRAGTGIKIYGDGALLNNPSRGELLLAGDIETSLQDSSKPLMGHLGVEWKPLSDLSLRAGIDQQLNIRSVETTMTLGAGYYVEGWQLDAALRPSATGGGSAIFSVSYFPMEFAQEDTAKVRYLKISTPQDDLVTDSSSVIINGEANGYRVQINGLDVFVSFDSKFYVEVPLEVGKNLIEISGVHENQKISFLRHILRKAGVRLAATKVLENEKTKINKQQENILKKLAEIARRERNANLSRAEKAKIAKDKKDLRKQKEKVDLAKRNIEQKEAWVEKKKQTVEGLATLGVIQVTGKQDFDTEDKITRAELAAWLVRARGLELPKVDEAPFADVPADFWAAPYIKAVFQKGLMKPYPDGKFHPLDGIKESDGTEIMKKFDQIR